ncbi:MAG: hypothetical protein M5U34_40385 [Chloroflexi bacterium]|nr:hypothetical protein [Chloroflexota bacterium]
MSAAKQSGTAQEEKATMSKHILVIGATLLDVKGKPTAGLEPATSNPATIRLSAVAQPAMWPKI